MTTPKPTNAAKPLSTTSTMGRKPVYQSPSNTVLNWSKAFSHKLLSTGPILNLGDACAYSCAFCYVEAMNKKRFKDFLQAEGEEFQNVVLRRCGREGQSTLEVLQRNLATKKWRELAREFHVCFTSSTVDPAANAELVEETAQAIVLILKLTRWHVRILSKSCNLPRLARRLEELFPGARKRVIFGVSTGTLDDKVARTIEVGTPLVSKRIQSLHTLQDEGFRTFGMICPSLPQHDYRSFSDATCAAIRVDLCEHIWAEPINVRGKSLVKTIAALRGAGLHDEAESLAAVSGPGKSTTWDNYAKATFVAHTHNVAPEKLRFLHYPTKLSLPWWRGQVPFGAILLGKLVHDTEEAAL